MFRNRVDAGMRLAWELSRYKDRSDALVLAIPRGGVPVGGVIARELDLPLNAILVAKLEHPDERETVIGAVSLTRVELDPAANGAGGASDEYVAAEVERVRVTLRRRYWSYHRAVRFSPVEGRIVILVDDEAGTAWPMQFAARRLRQEGAARIVAALPAASREAYAALSRVVDEIVCLRVVAAPGGVIGLYRDFRDVTEDDALETLRHHARGAASL